MQEAKVGTGITATLDAYKCDVLLMEDVDYMVITLQVAASLINTIVLDTYSFKHKFSPVGLSVVVTIKESHLTIHTFPEYGYASVDVYTCGRTHPKKAIEYIIKRLDCKKPVVRYRKRGGCKRWLKNR